MPSRSEKIVRLARSRRFRGSLFLVAIALGFVMLGVDPAPAEITDADMLNLGQTERQAALPESNPVSLGGLVLRMVFSLGAVFGLIFLVSWGAKKYLPNQVNSSRGGAIRVVSTRSVGPRRSLMLVSVQDKTILIGVTPQGMNFLADVEQGHGGWREATVQTGLDELIGAGSEGAMR